MHEFRKEECYQYRGRMVAVGTSIIIDQVFLPYAADGTLKRGGE